MEVRCVECRVRSGKSGLLILMVCLMLLSVPSLADRKTELDWRSDTLMIASVSLVGKSVTLKNVCRQFERQTSVEFYVDRRFADIPVSLQIRSAKLETAMTCIEEVTGLQWRLVDDMFFLTENARGIAVVRWRERYSEARKAQVVKTTESKVQEWLYDVMPFPPSFDPVWELTPLQREQIAYQNTLTVATMTPPQLDWLNDALLSKGFRSAEVRIPTDLLVQKAPDLEIKLNAAMVISSPHGALLIEKPLTAPAPKEAEPAPAKPVKTETLTVTEQKPAEKTALKGMLYGIRLTDAKPADLMKLLKTAKERSFDSVFVPVLSRGQAIYPSRALHPDIELLTSPDRLKPIIDAADSLGMRVHAVLDTTLWGDATHPVPKPASYPVVQDRNLLDRTYAEQAQWQQAESAALNSEPADVLPPADKSVYLCPASSQTARLVKAVAEEIVRNYKVAGICFDRLDYPRSSPLIVNGRDMTPPFGYTIEVRKEMIRAHQVDPIDIDPEGAADLESQAAWDKFRRGKLTGLITEAAAAVKAVKPELICSVSLNPESDAQSPGHWAQLVDVDVVLPTVKIDVADRAPVEEQADVQAVNALYAAVSKYAAVVPIVQGTDMQRLLDLMSALKWPKPEWGWLFSGSSTQVVKTLERFMTSGDR